jgi:hypothetical protein
MRVSRRKNREFCVCSALLQVGSGPLFEAQAPARAPTFQSPIPGKNPNGIHLYRVPGRPGPHLSNLKIQTSVRGIACAGKHPMEAPLLTGSRLGSEYDPLIKQ